MVSLTVQSWHVLKSWYTSRGPKLGLCDCFAEWLNPEFSSTQRRLISRCWFRWNAWLPGKNQSVHGLANNKEQSGLVNFVWQSRFVFIICTNQFPSPKNGHESLKTGLPFQTFRLFPKVFTWKTRKGVLHPLSKYNSRKSFVNGYKAPKRLLWLREVRQSTTSQVVLEVDLKSQGRVLLGRTVFGWLGWLGFFVFHCRKTVFGWFGCILSNYFKAWQTNINRINHTLI